MNHLSSSYDTFFPSEELDQINECWLPPPIISSVKFKSPFCTGSLSNSHLTAVMYLLSLLDNCDIMNKSVQPLQSLFDMDTNSTYEDMEITNQSWYNNSRSMGERSKSVLGEKFCSCCFLDLTKTSDCNIK